MKKILIVSLGSIGKRHLRNCRELLPDSEIAILRLKNNEDLSVPDGANKTFVDINLAKKFAPDSVIISSPASEHISNALSFLDVGSNVFLEKPLATSSTEEKLNDLIQMNKENSPYVMVGYVLRFQPIVGYLKKFISSGELGSIYTANIEVGQYLPDWRPGSDYRQGASAQKVLGGGALLELSHEIDYATWFFGFPDKVFCSSRKLSDLDIDVEDSACVIMDYKKNLRVTVQVDFLQRSACMRVKVVGSKGTLYADLIEEKADVVDTSGVTRALSVPKMQMGNEMYLRQFDFFFANCFKDYRVKYSDHHLYSEAVDIARGTSVLKLVDTAKESSQTGRQLTFGSEL